MTKGRCSWINKKGQPCPWSALSETCKFCKRHSVHDGVYTADDMTHMITCSGCNNLFVPNPTELYKQCTKCRETAKKTREKIKEEKQQTLKTCAGVTNNKTPCTYKCKDGSNYCEKHQSFQKWKELTDSGKNVCGNWIRGCFTIVENDKYKRCENCRKLSNEAEKKIALKRKTEATTHNRNIHKTPVCNANNENIVPTASALPYMCVKCNDLTDCLRNDKCLKCYNEYHVCENSRKARKLESVLNIKLCDYKKRALNRNIDWYLGDEFALKLFQEPCAYCNRLPIYNGIDRLDSNLGYTSTNVVACCKECNYMKETHSVDTFLNIVHYILAASEKIEPLSSKMKENFKKHFETRKRTISYAHFVREAQNRDIYSELTEISYNEIIAQPCTYCKNISKGVDRVNSSLGYVLTNVVPCCKTCNFLKKTMTTYQFYEHLELIYNFRIMKKAPPSTNSIVDEIKQLCQFTVPLPHEKFNHGHTHYENLTFGWNDGNNNIDAVKRIKICLEFVNTKEQRDIWNYYRRYVSSFKHIKGGKLIGRQMYILVKDLTTNKYLGIISLNSDAYAMTHRDEYIGWSIENKDRNLKHIMNISTCVPLQPFGHNFNGGKLITALAFSLDVATHYREKYDDSLLGLNTTSLYGKSIQYDRLPFVKFLGYTSGYSIANIPSEVTKLCANYLKQEYNYDYPVRKKLVIIHAAFKRLHIDINEFLKTNQKGIYFGFTCTNAKDILCGNIPPHMCPKYNQYVKPAADIFTWWIDRWATQRYAHLLNEGRLTNE